MPFRSDLRALIGGQSVARFVDECWDKRARFVPGGAAGIESVFDRGAFDRALRHPAPPGFGGVKAQYFDTEGQHVEFGLPAADPALVRSLLAAGMTICATDFDGRAAPLAALSTRVAAALGVPQAFDVACYLSDNTGGFGLHFDSVPVLVIQVEGEKRWWHGSSPAVTRPHASLVASQRDRVAAFARRLGRRLDIPGDDALTERCLTPGDALFLPAGTWHRTRAEGFSLGLTITLSPRRIDGLLVERIRQRVEDHTPWRPSVSDEPGRQWTTDRLRTVLAQIGQLDADDLLHPAPPGPIATERPTSPAVPHSPDAPLSARPRGEVGVFTAPDEGGEPTVFVTGPHDAALALPRDYAEPIEQMLRRPRFTVTDVQRWLPVGHRSAQAATELVAALLEIDVLRPQPPVGPVIAASCRQSTGS